MFCENCGKQLAPGSLFCDSCGAKTASQQSFNEQAATNNQGPERNNYQPPQPNTPPPYQQNQYANQGYQPNYYAPQQNAQVAPVMTVGQYIGMMLLMIIPLVNIILLFVWAFSSDTNPNKKNYCRAQLIMIAIGIVASILFGAVIVNILSWALSGLGGGYYY